MKSKVVILLLFITTFSMAQTGFNKDEQTFISVFVDPTFTDAGFQFGGEILKEMEWGFVSAAVSTYPELYDGYTDLVFTPGLVFNFFPNQNITLYGGPRVGVNFRGGDPYGMLGLSLKIQVKIVGELYAGIMLWVDHREDQKDEFYGDSDGHKAGLIFKGPLTQENGSGFITFKLN